ncbi:MAG: hypothetical protein IJ601_03175 [Acidaminococcaceae bacterium]|nr:hypothetical protein [Acidaminococcaceae bacterium]
MRELDKKLIENCDFIRDMLKNTSQKETVNNAIKAVDFKDGLPDYTNETQDAWYMMKYGKYYALEYYWMYDLALRVLSSKSSVSGETVVAYSFGCGSMLDGLSLLYAHSRLLESQNLNYHLKKKLYYSGIDIVEWPRQGNVRDIIADEGKDKIMVKTFLQSGMVDFWKKMNMFCANILVFPKMLSENLDKGNEPIINQFTEKLQNATLSKDYIILCISYRGSKTFSVDNVLVEKIVSAMEQKGYKSDPFDKGIYGNWICNDYFELKDSKKMVFISKENCEIDYNKTYSDFSVPEKVEEYLRQGILDDGGDMVCKSYPRKNLNSTGGKTCMQVLPFKKN